MNLDFSKFTILVVGDVMIDRYMYGEIFRKSPEADIPVLENIVIDNRLGGAANVALNIEALGATAILCGVVGDDENKDVFIKEMKRCNLNATYLISDSKRKTTVKTRVISDNKHIVRVDIEDTFDIDSSISNRVLSNIEYIVGSGKIDMIIFQDYNKGLLTPELIKEIILLAKIHEIPTAVDPKKENFLAYQGVTIFKPNKREIEDQLGSIKNVDRDEIRKSAKALRSLNHAQYIFITLSEHGVYYDDGINYGICPVPKGEIVDVSGAGDSVLSIICLALLNNYNILDIASLSNAVGVQVCGLPGVVPIDFKLLKSR